MEILHCVERVKNSVHSAKKIRRGGGVPGILYGEKLRNIMFEISEMELNKEILKGGEHGIINVDINGTTHKTLIKEIQRDPVNHNLIHIDLEEINGNKTIISEVPIMFNGEAMVGKTGGILQKEKDIVKIQCKADKLPKYINVDLRECKVGDVFRLGDLEVAEEITFMEDMNSVIASITGGNTSMTAVNESDDEIPKEIKK
jgi:large subunit ribosomal protein L25